MGSGLLQRDHAKPRSFAKLGEEGPELGAEVVAVQGQLDRGPQVVELLADVVATVGEAVAVDGLVVEQQGDGVGELDLAAGAGLDAVERRRRSPA